MARTFRMNNGIGWQNCMIMDRQRNRNKTTGSCALSATLVSYVHTRQNLLSILRQKSKLRRWVDYWLMLEDENRVWIRFARAGAERRQSFQESIRICGVAGENVGKRRVFTNHR